MKDKRSEVKKRVLKNGMTVLVLPIHTIPKVSLQLWYNVGSKDEASGQKGLAHFIEHMIFKGTQTLSESDINEITHKLSGSCNAFTSYDYTGYLFDIPTQNWPMILPIMADCMRNCTFKQDPLNSELKAVIQELKLYNDSYTTVLLENMVGAIFPDHPYHFPIIGHKQDLWNLSREALVQFYKKHYVPNNATLIAVGDVQEDLFFDLAEQHFSGIKADPSYKKELFYHNKDIVSQSVTLYRDVQQAVVLLAFVVPGSIEKMEYQLDVLSWILASGKGSRLYMKLVDELELATDVDSFCYDLFEHGLFFIEFQPKNGDSIDKIVDIIMQEIASLVKNGIPTPELERARKKTEVDFLSLLESNQKQAYLIGKLYLATGDENYLFKFLDHDASSLQKEIHDLLTNCFRPTVMHSGLLLPLPEEEQRYWLNLQEISDKEDERILAGKERQSTVESAVVAQKIVPNAPFVFEYPHHTKVMLKNGLELLYYHDKRLPKIEMILEFKAKSYYDPDGKEGLYSFMGAVMNEGTASYTGAQLAHEIESRGMNLDVDAGYIGMNMLKVDLEFALSVLKEIVADATFDSRAIEKVRAHVTSDIKNYWDEPTEFISDLIQKKIYEGHPYSKNKLGTLETIKKITREDLLSFYRTYMSPHGARIALVGDFDSVNLIDIVEKTIGKWQGPEVASISYPVLKNMNYEEINYPMKRDQVVVCFAGLSVNRADKDYDKLLIFDQIFTGGILGSMSSRLFQLREQTGLFYTIGGSVIANADEQPGMVIIKTVVSVDRLKEAENAIKNQIAAIAESITPEEFVSARNAIVNVMVDNFETDRQMAATFLALERFGLPVDYFDRRAEQFMKITFKEVQEAARRIISADKMVLFKIGRVNSN